MNNQLELIRDLSCGINEHQAAKLYKSEKTLEYEADFELSYSDIKSLTLALSVAAEFYDVKAIISTSISHLFGVALAATLEEAFTKVMDANPIDIQFSTIAATGPVDIELARMLSKNNIVVAPEFTEDAIKYLQKKEIKFVTLKTPLSEFKQFIADKITITPFGTIVEAPNMSELNKDTFKVETVTKPTVEQIEDAVFAWKLVKHVKSRGVIITKGFKTTAIIQGVQNSALELALDYSCDTSKDAIIATDGMITTHDVEVAAQGRISTIILPIVTEEIVKLADKYKMIVITTGFTNYLD